MFTLALKCDRTYKGISSTSQHLFRLRITPEANISISLPLKIAIALDTSSSMTGEKLQKAKEACIAIVNNLRPQDSLFLASYSTKVTTLLNQNNNKNEAIQTINNLQATGVTRTDLALNWFQEILPPETGVARVGILITDGNATDQNGMMLDNTTFILEKGQQISQTGIIIDTVGLGNAENFNSPFLTDLSEKGKGVFTYADNPDNFQSLLTNRLNSYQTVAIEDAKLKITPQNNSQITGFCRLRPDFLPLEEIRKNEILLGTIRNNYPTDILISVEVPPAEFGDKNGEKDIIEIELIPSNNYQTIKTTGTLKYTSSYKEIQEINKEIDDDRLRWELNISSYELNRTNDPNKTGDLLINMQVAATKIGKPELAKTAALTYENLQKTGKLTPHQTTSLLRDTRKTD